MQSRIADRPLCLSLTCRHSTGGCTKLNIVDEWPGEGSTSTLYDCITNLKGIDTDVDASTLFWAVPDFILTQGTEDSWLLPLQYVWMDVLIFVVL